jgi:hypothetical protein
MYSYHNHQVLTKAKEADLVSMRNNKLAIERVFCRLRRR